MANLPERRRHSWSPMKELQSEIDHLFEGFFDPGSRSTGLELSGLGGDFLPACDIEDQGDRYLLSFDLPGVKKEDVKIEITDEGLLVVSGERKMEKKEDRKGRHRVERSYGSFARGFSLPAGFDSEKIQAEYRDGVLEIVVPKSERVKTRRVEIGSRGEDQKGKAA